MKKENERRTTENCRNVDECKEFQEVIENQGGNENRVSEEENGRLIMKTDRKKEIFRKTSYFKC